MATLEEQYWDQRYIEEGTSGEGSIGEKGDFKWSIIDKHVPILQSVVDVGCGDLSFWAKRDCNDYTGIDISKSIVERNRILRPDWEFIWSNAETSIEGLTKDTVFCFDVLFHIMNDETYHEILENLTHYSRNHIFIYTWIRRPFQKTRLIKRLLEAVVKFKPFRAIRLLKRILLSDLNTDGEYQYYRPLERDIGIFEEKGYRLAEIARHPDKIGAMYVFERGGACSCPDSPEIIVY
jgi:hypothetical protein